MEMETLQCEEGKGNNNEGHKEKKLEKRSQWSRNFDYILSFLGYTIGPSNLWRFPYLCAKNGGAVFLIPYVIFMIIFGFPMALMEQSLGQYSGKSAFDVWCICPALKGIGLAMNAISVVYGLYYTIILSWILFYFYHSFMSPLPWTNCNNWWNTDRCVANFQTPDNITNVTVSENYTLYNYTVLPLNLTTMATNTSGLLANKTFTSSEEFWSNNLLRMSSGLDDIGEIQWHLVLALSIGWIMIFLCIIKGVETVGKVVYVTAIGPFILLFMLFIRAVTLPGAVIGITYYVIPDFERLLDIQVWIHALMQIFFSLGIGWGVFVTLSSYNKYDSNVVRNSVIFCVIGEGTSFFAGFVVFAVMGFLSEKTGQDVSEVATAGPGLAFITYPEALSQLPVPQIWSALFFLTLLLLTIDSLFVSLEIIITAIVDILPRPTMKIRMCVTAGVCVFMFIGSLIYTTQAGVYIFQLVDWYMASLSIFIITFLECMIVGWIYGVDRFFKDIESMVGSKPSLFVKILWRFVTPVILVTAFCFTLAKFNPPTYGDYVYPSYTKIIGWSIAIVTSIPIPIWFIKEIKGRKGPLKERIKSAFKPTDQWQPAIKAQIEDSNIDETSTNEKLLYNTD